SFVLDRISAVLERIPGYRGKDRGVPVEAAVVGFSLGGAVATEWCRTDPRCGAAVNMDGGLFGSRPLDAVEVPYLMLYSETSEGGNDSLKAVSGEPSRRPRCPAPATSTSATRPCCGERSNGSVCSAGPAA